MRGNEITPQQKQKGVSGIFILIFLAMTALILLSAFKLYPVYFDHWAIKSVAESYEDNTELSEMSEREIIKNFQKRLITNGIRDFSFKDSVFIEKLDGEVIIDIEYERRVNIYKNVDAVVSFKDERTIKF